MGFFWEFCAHSPLVKVDKILPNQKGFRVTRKIQTLPSPRLLPLAKLLDFNIFSKFACHSNKAKRYSRILFCFLLQTKKRIAKTSRAISFLHITRTILSEEPEPQTKIQLWSASYLILNAESISKYNKWAQNKYLQFWRL